MSHLRSGLLAAAAGALLMLAASPVLAEESGLGPYPKGTAGFMSGILPPDSGFYLIDQYYYFNGKAGADVRQGTVQFNINATLNADFLTGLYVTNAKIFGGQYAFNIALAYAWIDLGASLDTPIGGKSISASTNALADTIVTPVLLGWHDGYFNWTVGLSVYVPTGEYSRTQLSTGKNYWAFMPSYAITYFDPKSGWDVSTSFTYSTMSENSATDYQSGDILNLDWAIGKHFGPAGQWEIGVVGNAQQQIGADRGNGAKLGPLKAESWGLGPGVNYGTKFGSVPVSFGVKWEHDFDAHDTFKGDVVTASLTAVF